MKILLATDGSKYSKTAINEIANRPFPPKTEVCILAAYEITSILNTLEPMGVSHEYNAKFDENAFKNAEKNAKSAAEILENKNPNLLVTTKIVAGSPKSVILNEAEKFKADLIISWFTRIWSNRAFCFRLCFAFSCVTCKMFGRNCS